MELAVAFSLQKRIFLLFPTPDYKIHTWAREVVMMQPIVLNGSLKNIPEGGMLG